MKNKRLWFKAKRFGWGWTPVSWQGWVLTLIYVLGIVNFAMQADTAPTGSAFFTSFAPKFILLSVPFIAICWMKGERPHWRWGGRR
jgi:hypothetical protein